MSGVFTGHYLDGRSAARRQASIRLTPTGLEITLEGGASLWWPLREVRQTQGFYAGEQIRLERGGPLPETLLVDDPGFLGALHAAAPALGRRFHDPRRRRARVLFTIVAAVTAVAAGSVLYVWGIPAAAGLLAAPVPVAWEERLRQAGLGPPPAENRKRGGPRREAGHRAVGTRLPCPGPPG